MPKALYYGKVSLLLLCLQVWIGSTLKVVNISTADDLVREVRQFAATGEDTNIYLVRNITFSGTNTNEWPVRNLRNGTIKIRPHSSLEAAGVPVFVDWAMERGLTEPFSGARIECENMYLLNLCFADLLFNPAKDYHFIGGFMFLAFERSR